MLYGGVKYLAAEVHLHVFLNILVTVLCIATVLKADVAKKTKLCGDPKCAERLFETKLTRGYDGKHQFFLQYKINDTINVYAIRMSDRPYLLEGMLQNKPDQRGYFYSTHMETEEYIRFLEDALKKNKTLYKISAEEEDLASPKVVGTTSAVPELLKEYEKVLNTSAIEKGVPPPPLDLTKFGIRSETKDQSGHEHSYSGHGHSHDGHEHLHGPYSGLHEAQDEFRIAPGPGKKHDSQGDAPNIHGHSQSAPDLVGEQVFPQESNSMPTPEEPKEQSPNLQDLSKKTTDESAAQLEDQSFKTKISTSGSEDHAQAPLPPSDNMHHEKDFVNDKQSETGPLLQHEPHSQVLTPIGEKASGEKEQEIDTSVEGIDNNHLVQSVSSPVANLNKETSGGATATSDHTFVSTDKVELPNATLQHNLSVSPVTSPDVAPAGHIPSTMNVISNPSLSPSTVQTSHSENKEEVVRNPAANEGFSTEIQGSTDQNSTPESSITVEMIPVGTSVPVTETMSTPFFSNEPTTILSTYVGDASYTSTTPMPSYVKIPVTATTMVALTGNAIPYASDYQTTTVSSEQSFSRPSPSAVEASSSSVPRTVSHTTIQSYQETSVTLSSTDPNKDGVLYSSVSTETSKASSAVPNAEHTTILLGSQDYHVVETSTVLGAVKGAHLHHTDDTQVSGRYDVIGKDGLGYCVKGDCVDVFSENAFVQESKVENKSVYDYIGNLSVMFLLPSGGVDFIKVVFFILGSLLLLIHFLLMAFFSESGKENIESKMLHDALSAVRARDQRIKELRQEIDRGQKASDNQERIKKLESKLEESLKELKEYKTKHLSLEDELQKLEKRNKELVNSLTRGEEKVKKLTCDLEISERSKHMLSEQLSEMQSNIENARENNDLLEKEVADKDALISRQSHKIEADSSEIKTLREQLRVSTEDQRALRKQIDDLQFENAQLSELYDEMQKSAKLADMLSATNKSEVSEEHAAHESGGSGGWSDIGDFDIDPPEEKKNSLAQTALSNKGVKEESVELHTSQAAIIVEVARLRGHLERAKLKMQEEEKNREELVRRLDLAECEVVKCRREVEAKEAERIDMNSQCKKLLAMVEEKDGKIKRLDEVIERLREKKSEVQEEINNLTEQKLHLETRLNEVEQEMKRLQMDHDRLKKRHFHELRECRQENSILQQRLKSKEISRDEKLDNSDNLLSLSCNSPEQSAVSPKMLLSGLSVPPLWSDRDTDVFSGAESSQAERSTVSRNRQLPLDDASQHISSKVSKGRHREHREGSPEPSSTRTKKEGKRMRSRSHGRSTYYVAAGMPFPYGSGYDSRVVRREYLSGSNLYYSSGGSNGGLSPPPLPLLSGVPPLDVGIRKPTASTRPKSVVEHGTKNQT